MAVPHDDLPEDLERALLVGRVWRPAPVDGPCVVAVRGGRLYDLTAVTPTLADLLDRGDRVALARNAAGECLGPAADWLAGRAAGAMLAPCDLQP
ncbi:fumarylacetoacetate hydrolase, partial [Bordetella bronchiseptica]